jgi:hypothetical protein
MSMQAHSARGGVTLRHWTTDSLSFMGGREQPSPALSGLADGRRLNLVASLLKAIKAPPATPAEVRIGQR